MKKQINKIVMVVGFLVTLVGLLIWAVSDMEIDGSLVKGTALEELELFLIPDLMNVSFIAMVLAVAFVFAKNNTVKNVGYGLSALIGIDGVLTLVSLSKIDENVLENRAGIIVTAVGLIVMMVAALLYFGMLCMDFFGFVKKSEKDDAIETLAKYKELQQENVLTAEEFENVKEKLLNKTTASNKKNGEIDVLKKWKKLLDQNVITEEEFAKIKLGIFGK